MRQGSEPPTLLLLETIVNYKAFVLLTRGLFEHIVDSIFVLLYWILLLHSITGLLDFDPNDVNVLNFA